MLIVQSIQRTRSRKVYLACQRLCEIPKLRCNSGKSEWSAEERELNRNSQKWLKKLEFRGQIFNKYKQRDTCAYVAARVPAVYCAVYRVLIEVHLFAFYFY